MYSKDMKILKIIFLLIIVFFSILFLLVDFSFLFLNFPEIKKDFTSLVKKKGIEIINSSPLNIEREGKYFLLENKKVIEETNNERKKYGLLPFTENERLNFSASLKNGDMCEKQYFEHISPNGEGPGDLIKKAGYEFITVAENLAMGSFLNEKELVESWMNSKGHRENILNKNYLEIGVSVLKCNYRGRSIWLATKHFGTSLFSCPLIDKSLENKINSNKEKLEDLYLEIEKIESELSFFKIKRSNQYHEKYRIYGELVGKYNILVAETEKLITDYNGQIVLFNECTDSFK